ncbi:hypothetical protein AB4Z29_18440 [Paenibacillus sp. 2TAB23]|uniref:ATP-dependent DNA ligase n=1 Tax=Paenibacillus sp. 2TAB23 TaxID=3233004 RepID=UPI003F97B170
MKTPIVGVLFFFGQDKKYFDILKHRGKSVMNMPLLERKQLLDEVTVNQPQLFYIQEKGIELFGKIKQFELEGMVAKSKNSRYYSTDGQPSIRKKDVWVKIINWRYDICLLLDTAKIRKGGILQHLLMMVSSRKWG